MVVPFCCDKRTLFHEHSPGAGSGPFPAVLFIHENRGLKPYVEDVARRAAVEGFLALAPSRLLTSLWKSGEVA